MVKTESFQIKTNGYNDTQNITEQINKIISRAGINNGIALVSCPGSTAGITTIEFESGAVADLKRTLEKIAPENGEYQHNERWHDGNGYAHVRSALLKPFFSVSVIDGELVLGTWQQIIFIDFDNKSRTRKIYVQVTGE